MVITPSTRAAGSPYSNVARPLKPAAARRLQSAIHALGKVDRQLAGFRAFFTSANLDRISKRGAHSDAPIAISVSLSDFGGLGRKMFDLDGGEGGDFASS